MIRNLLTMTLLAVTLSACGDVAYEERVNQDKQNFFQNTVDRVLAIFKNEPTEEEPQETESTPAKFTQNSKKKLSVQNHLSQIMANMQSTHQTPDQKTEKEELEQYRQDYAQAVDVEDKVYALTALVQANEKNAVPLLKEAYANQEPELRKEAVLHMQNFNDKKEVVDMLLKALDDPDSDVVIEAIEGLSSLESKRVIEGLKKVAKSHPDELIREVAQDYVDLAEESGQQSRANY